jgi:hypothetical protein
MSSLDIEKGKGAKAREVFLSLEELRLQEVFAVSEDLSARELRSLGYRPLEELFPNQVIDGYAKLGKTLYAPTWE